MNNIINIIPKTYTREYMLEHSDTIFRNRELIVEVDEDKIDGTKTVYRFKMCDGIRPYSSLPYISSLYDLIPYFVLYGVDYKTGISINFN